jgi:hypothetical protein
MATLIAGVTSAVPAWKASVQAEPPSGLACYMSFKQVEYE